MDALHDNVLDGIVAETDAGIVVAVSQLEDEVQLGKGMGEDDGNESPLRVREGKCRRFHAQQVCCVEVFLRTLVGPKAQVGSRRVHGVADGHIEIVGTERAIPSGRISDGRGFILPQESFRRRPHSAVILDDGFEVTEHVVGPRHLEEKHLQVRSRHTGAGTVYADGERHRGRALLRPADRFLRAGSQRQGRNSCQ